MQVMIGKLTQKQKKSIKAYNRNLSQKVKAARETNKNMDSVAERARLHQEQKMEKKYEQFQEAVKKFHEKLLIRQENIDWKQYETKIANEKRYEHHLQTSKNIKQLDRDKLLQSIEGK